MPLKLQFLGLLSSMSVSSARINLQLTIHVATQWVFRQHAFNRGLDHALRGFGDQLFEVDRLDAARKTGVGGVHFVSGFSASNTYLLSVDDDDVITGDDVRGGRRIVLATQTARGCCGKPTKGRARTRADQTAP